MYADDTTLLLEHENRDTLYIKIISELNYVELWLSSNS